MATRELNGDAVRELRNALGLSQRDLAARSGVTQGAISNIERGKFGSTPQMARKLADGLGVSLAAVTHVVPEVTPAAEAVTV